MDHRKQLHPAWPAESQEDHGSQPRSGGPGLVVWLGRTEMEQIPPFLLPLPGRKNSPGRPSDSLWQQRPGEGEEHRAGHDDEEGPAAPARPVSRDEAGVLPDHPEGQVGCCKAGAN